MSKASLYVAGQFILLGIFATALVVFPMGQYPVGRAIGLLLIAAAVVILALAVREFAIRNRTIPNITPTPTTAAALVESGVYSRVRHPIYTSVLMGSIGVALVHGHFAIMLVALVLVVFFTVKSRFEESLLRTAYPQYDAYMTRTGRFLPYL
ncbi:MAG: isoprenylcysteine carboxylmethyltransferase family protein [Anaerolineae bacterium]|nr:isoprenylcysteine carboxylmethyltransferase family protein [Anaerolineae bacterium]